MTGRRQRREKIRHLQEPQHRLKLSTIENLTTRWRKAANRTKRTG